MTPNEWHEHPGLVSGLGDFLKSPTGQAFRSVLEAQTPALIRQPGVAMQAIDAAIELGWTNGHRACLRLIDALAEPKPEQQEDEEAGGPDEEFDKHRVKK